MTFRRPGGLCRMPSLGVSSLHLGRASCAAPFLAWIVGDHPLRVPLCGSRRRANGRSCGVRMPGFAAFCCSARLWQRDLRHCRGGRPHSPCSPPPGWLRAAAFAIPAFWLPTLLSSPTLVGRTAQEPCQFQAAIYVAWEIQVIASFGRTLGCSRDLTFSENAEIAARLTGRWGEKRRRH